MRKIFIAIFLSFLSLPAWAVNYCNDSSTGGGWELDEDTWQDCTINDNDGVMSGVITVIAAKYDNGARFTSDNNTYINFGSDAELDNVFDGGGTFAMWAAIDDPGAADGLLCTGGTIISKGPADGWELCVNSDGSLSFGTKFEYGYNIWKTDTTPFSAFDFTAKHIMVYYNSDSADNDPIIAIDCSAQSITQTVTSSGTRNTDSGFDLILGIENTLEVGELTGVIDDVILYNGDLTSVCTELAANGIDGSHGIGGSEDISAVGGKVINGATLNDLTF